MLSTDFSLSDLQFMLAGAWVSLQLTLWAMLIGTVSGAVFGLLRAIYPRASAPLGWLLDVFRCVPRLIQFVLFNSFNSIAGIHWTAFAIGCLVLGIYCASYCTEVIRGGVLAVPPNVVRAARSLGLSYTQTLRYIIMPMAARVSFPGWINLTLGVVKDTSLVLWIGIMELLRASQSIVTRIQEPLLVLSIAGLMYYIMSWGIARIGQRVEKGWQEND